MSAERYTLDANVLLYAADRDAGSKHEVARQLVLAAADRNCVFTLQALAETYNVTVRKKPEWAFAANRILERVLLTVPVVSSTTEDLEAALAVHKAHMIQFWDAMLWATAKRNLCAVILTEDIPGRAELNGVRYRNPFAERSLLWLTDYL